MKKITLEEFNRATHGRNRMKPITDYARALNVDEGMFVSYEDYEKTGITTPFTAYFHQYFRANRTDAKFTIRKSEKDRGWFVLRNK